MNKIILYGSRYGSTERYAREFAKRTGIRAASREEAGDLSDCDEVLYFGGLYAGSVLGLKETAGKLPKKAGFGLTVITVGLADPDEEENIRNIHRAVQKAVPEGLFDESRIFCLRGAIDYQRMSFKHRAMMWAMYRHLKKIPPEERRADVQSIIDTYHKKADFVDFESLNKIVDAVM